MPWNRKRGVVSTLGQRSTLVLIALTVGCGSVSDLHPQYARVLGKIETLWQRPHGEPKGIFFMAHGCKHQATDFFSFEGPQDGWRFEACKQSNYGDCLGLPEETRMRQVARARGYVVVAVSGGSGRQSCWDLEHDVENVRNALGHVRLVEHLGQELPLFAMGASSGGQLVGALAAREGAGLPGLACIVPMIMNNPFENRGVPTLYVYMPRDTRSQFFIEEELQLLKGRGIPSSEIQEAPSPVSLALLGRCLVKEVALEVLAALRQAGSVDAEGFLREDPRVGAWVDPVRAAIRGRSTDSLQPDESCLCEELNLAWAMHEFVANNTERMLDFCEKHAVLAGPAQTTAAPAANLRGSSPVLEAAVKQVLVFDAGSSGTRVHIFDLVSPLQGDHVPTLQQRKSKKEKPGLSHFAKEDVDGVSTHIKQLLEYADILVPAARRIETPVLLKATAGLRSVSESRAEAVLDRVKQSLQASGYLFLPAWADIIKGKEEAGLAWVAANFLQGTFEGSGETESLGIIELGGGSTQVSFQVSPSASVLESDSFVFETAVGKKYHLYAHSYQGYGQDYAQKRLRDAIPKRLPTDPCYPPGYSRPYESLEIRGSGNSSACSDLIEASLFRGSAEAPGHYSGERPLHGKFLATQNFFFVRQDLHYEMNSSETEMERQSQKACALQHTAPSEDPGKPDPSKPNGCFGLSYQLTMLRSLGIHRSKEASFQITNSVRGSDADWALGAALVHFLQTPGKKSPVGTRAASSAASGVRLLASLAAALLLLVLLRLLVWPRFRSSRIYKVATSPDATKVGKVFPAE